METKTVSNVVRAQVLCAVQLHDSLYGSYNRKWDIISAFTNCGLGIQQTRRIFESQIYTKVSTQSSKVVSTLDSAIDKPLGSMINKNTDNELAKQEEIVEAMEVLAPSTIFSWLCIHFLGYAQDPINDEEPLTKFFERISIGKTQIHADRRLLYETYMTSPTSLENHSDFSIQYVKETKELLSRFEPNRRPLVQNVVVGDRGILLKDVSYYRRRLVDRSGKLVGFVPSDLEMFQIYTTVLAKNFDFDGATDRDWERFLSAYQVISPYGKTAQETRMDLIKFFLPRISLLQKRFGWGRLLGNVQLCHYSSVGIAVVYHSVRGPTMIDILTALQTLINDGVLVVDSGYGLNVLPWIMALLIMSCKASILGISVRDHGTFKMKLARDVLDKYCTVQNDLFQNECIAIRA